MENTSSWSVWKVKAGFDLNYSRYKSNEYRKVFANALREYDYHTDLSLWRWGMFASVDYAAPDKRVVMWDCIISFLLIPP